MSIITWLTRLCRRSPPPAQSSHQTTPVAPPAGGDVSLPDIANPDTKRALAVWDAYRKIQPDITCAEYIINLESILRRAERERAGRQAELTRISSQSRFKP